MGALLGGSNEPLASVGRFKVGVPPIIRMRALLIVARLFQMGLLCGSVGGLAALSIWTSASRRFSSALGIGFMTHLRFLQIE
jgi:hypothetical protein